MERFDLGWYIVLTVEGVQHFIPNYKQEGNAPYLVISLGDKGCMVWPIEVVKDIMQGYITAHDKLLELKDEYGNETSMDDPKSGESHWQNSKSVKSA